MNNLHYDLKTTEAQDDEKLQVALDRYNEHYDNTLYTAAANEDYVLGCNLQDAALQLCGSPYEKNSISYLFLTTSFVTEDQGTAILKFLALFL